MAQVAFITGGASGMGLAVVEDLAAKGWKITIFDFDRESGEKVAQRLGDQVFFVKGNVTKYEELGAAFAETWKKWGSVNFVFANAGIGERTKFYEPQDELPEGIPAKPSVLTLEVNIIGVVYTSYLAMHFFRKNASKGGALVMTSSAAALYVSPTLSMYASAKHAIVGLTRCMGAALKSESITVNCICPGMVTTALLPPAFTAGMEADMLTPKSTIVKAINNFISDQSLTGQVAECSGLDIIYRSPHEPANEAARYMLSQQTPEAMAKIDLAGARRYVKEKKEYYDMMEAS